MRKPSLVLLAALSLTAFSTSAYAHSGGPKGAFAGPGMDFGGPGMMLEHMADHLDLTDEQRDAVRNVLEASKPEAEALREQWRANREALEALDPDDAAYETELNNIALSNGELATRGTLLFTRVRTEIDAVLTDEQREKLERGKDRMRRHAEHRRDRPDRPHGPQGSEWQ